jgi:hypothetical protein
MHHGLKAGHPAYMPMAPVVYEPDGDEKKPVKYSENTGMTDVKRGLLRRLRRE